MASKNTKQDERPAESVASPAENEALEHTRGGATTRDALDAGVPMTQESGKDGKPADPERVPEDAMGFHKTRGDYSGRVDQGPHMVTVPIPEDERGTRYFDGDGKEVKDPDKAAWSEPGPAYKLVEQGAATPEAPGIDAPHVAGPE